MIDIGQTRRKMTTQENVDRLIKMIGAATTQLTVMQGVMAELMNILIQQNDTNREREDG